MKRVIKNILIILTVLMTGCAVTSGNTKTDSAAGNHNEAENNGLIEGKLKPFVDKTIKDENINIGIPIYKF